MTRRVFVIVLDSFGIGEAPDAANFGDVGANTLAGVYKTGNLNIPNMTAMGLGTIDGVECLEKAIAPTATVARLKELSMGKDTTTGHWEMGGIISEAPMPTFPNGFPVAKHFATFPTPVQTLFAITENSTLKPVISLFTRLLTAYFKSPLTKT